MKKYITDKNAKKLFVSLLLSTIEFELNNNNDLQIRKNATGFEIAKIRIVQQEEKDKTYEIVSEVIFYDNSNKLSYTSWVFNSFNKADFVVAQTTELLYSKTPELFVAGNQILLIAKWKWAKNVATYHIDGTWDGVWNNSEKHNGTWKIIGNELHLFRNGTGIEIKAKVTEVSDEKIKYKKITTPNGPAYEYNISDISWIKYQNGEVEYFNQSPVQKKQPAIITQMSFNTDSIMNELKKQLHPDTGFVSRLTMQNGQLQEIMTELAQAQQNNQNTLLDEIKKLSEELNNQKETLENQTRQFADSLKRINSNIYNIATRKESNWKPRPIGIGFNFANVNLFSEISDVLFDDEFNLSLDYSVLLPLTLHKNFRLEPEFSFFSLTRKFNVPITITITERYKHISKQFAVGGGIVPMVQLKRANITFGFRFIYHKYNFEEFKNNDFIYRYEISAFNLAPFIGGEYLFGDHFSLGGEADFCFSIDGKSEEKVGSALLKTDDIFSVYALQARFFARVYF
ncbi:MAG: hypothetical protein HY738_13710 [Bacteroidia bacterium]|nr:hypothetical protein [Bacteroidia bacterium]